MEHFLLKVHEQEKFNDTIWTISQLASIGYLTKFWWAWIDDIVQLNCFVCVILHRLNFFTLELQTLFHFLCSLVSVYVTFLPSRLPRRRSHRRRWQRASVREGGRQRSRHPPAKTSCVKRETGHTFDKGSNALSLWPLLDYYNECTLSRSRQEQGRQIRRWNRLWNKCKTKQIRSHTHPCETVSVKSPMTIDKNPISLVQILTSWKLDFLKISLSPFSISYLSTVKLARLKRREISAYSQPH